LQSWIGEPGILLWVVAEPLAVENARCALKRTGPDLDRYLADHSIEIVVARDWYLRDGTFDLDRVINGWNEKLASASARGSMRTELAEALPKVMADRVQLQQILMNLMLNGIDAMKETTDGGELTIKSKAGDGQLLISVSDTGAGLPSEKSDQVFRAFFTTKNNGTGWVCPSVGRSLNRMAVACGSAIPLDGVQLFSSRCRSRSRRTHNMPVNCSPSSSR